MPDPYPLPLDVAERIREALMQRALYLLDYDEVEASDRVHEIFARIVPLLRKYRGPRPPWNQEEAEQQERRFVAYLCTCLRRELSNARAKDDRRRKLLDEHFQQEPPSADGHGAALTRVAVQQVLSKAPPADASLLYDRFITGGSYAEIAATAGISEPAARVRVHRALKALRKRFQP